MNLAAHIREALERFRSNSKLFSCLGNDALDALAGRAVVEYLPADFLVMRQDELGTAFYLVVRGEISVQVEGAKAPSGEVARLGPGNFFGEMGFIAGEPRSASIRTRKATELVRFEREPILPILNEHPKARQILGAVGLERTAENLDSMVQDNDSVSLDELLTGGGDVDGDDGIAVATEDALGSEVEIEVDVAVDDDDDESESDGDDDHSIDTELDTGLDADEDALALDAAGDFDAATQQIAVDELSQEAGLDVETSDLGEDPLEFDVGDTVALGSAAIEDEPNASLASESSGDEYGFLQDEFETETDVLAAELDTDNTAWDTDDAVAGDEEGFEESDEESKADFAGAEDPDHGDTLGMEANEESLDLDFSDEQEDADLASAQDEADAFELDLDDAADPLAEADAILGDLDL